MNESGQFWYSIWRMIGVCFCVMVMSISGCVAHDTYQAAELVKKGNDPLRVECMFGDMTSPGRSIMCAELSKK